MKDHIVFDPFNILMEAAGNDPAPRPVDDPAPRVYLCDKYNKNDRRDITDIFAGYIEKSDGVTVIYTHWIVNGKKEAGRHSIHHRNAYIDIERT